MTWLSYTRHKALLKFLTTIRITRVVVTGGRRKIHCFKSTISLCLTGNYKQCIGAGGASFLPYIVEYFVFLIWRSPTFHNRNLLIVGPYRFRSENR